MVEFTEEELDTIARIFNSLRQQTNANKYVAKLPEVLASRLDEVETIEAYGIRKLFESSNIDAVMIRLRKAVDRIQYKKEDIGYRKYKYFVKSCRELRIIWRGICSAGRALEVLDYMSERDKDGYKFKLRGCAKEELIKIMVARDLLGKDDNITEDFLNFVIDGKGKKYITVPAKKMIIEYLHDQNRYDEMYRFCGAGSKVLDDLVVRLARHEDLPFLLDAKGKAAATRIEKRLDKGN